MSSLSKLIDSLSWDRAEFDEEPDEQSKPTLIDSKEIAKRCSVSQRQVGRWVNQGLVTPLARSKGSGYLNEWAEYQIGEIVEVRELLKKDRGHY